MKTSAQARRAVRLVPEARRAPSKWRLSVIVTMSLAAMIVGLVGGAGYALLSSNASSAGGAVTSGDLSLVLGEPRWEQVTPAVVNPASGLLTSTPPDFYSMPGDVIDIIIPVTAYLRGDNLAGAISVDYADPEAADPSLSVTFHVENQAGDRVAPVGGEANLGDHVVVSGLVGDNDGETSQWNVVVRVSVGGDFTWLTPTDPVPARSQTWDTGTLNVNLIQTRHGTSTSDGGTGS